MSDEELEEYINKIEANFDSHLEKVTIEMSNEYYNLLEERMARLINKNQQLKNEIEEYKNPIKYFKYANKNVTDENLQLKKELEKADSITQSCILNGKKGSSISYRKCLNMLENLKEENKQLKKQLEEKQNPLKGIFVQVNDDTLLRDCGNMNAEINELKNQQKEFIEYLSGYIEMLSPPYSNNNEDIVKITKSILSIYKKINHIPDNGKMVGDDK